MWTTYGMNLAIYLMMPFWQIALLPTAEAAYIIEGQISLTEEWAPRIYLSAIPSFEERNAVSDDYIINMAEITADGHFRLEGDNIPSDDRLYRLHVSKFDDPVSTIMIGGKEENHFHFVMDNSDHLYFKTKGDTPLFADYQMSGNVANQLLDSLQAAIDYWTNPALLNTRANRQYNEERLNYFLRTFADTCSNHLLSLMAVHHLEPEIDFAAHPEWYASLLDRYNAEKYESPFLDNYRQQVAFLRYHQKPKWTLWPIVFLIAALAVLFFWAGRRIIDRRSNADPPDRDVLLSGQENKVYALLQQGHSNKEISSELNIEVSTVKSHVHRIYNKLGIKSRKEVIQRGNE